MELLIDQSLTATSELNGDSEKQAESGRVAPSGVYDLQSEVANLMQREVGNLRLILRVNSRLRLETLSALSKVFREHSVIITDELLSSLVFAIPDELPGESNLIKLAMKTSLASRGGKDGVPPQPSAPNKKSSKKIQPSKKKQPPKKKQSPRKK